jgi:hypothetical protein
MCEREREKSWKAFEKRYQMEKLHCSSENNTENQNKYFILISIETYTRMFLLIFLEILTHSCSYSCKSLLPCFDIPKYNWKAITLFDLEICFKTLFLKNFKSNIEKSFFFLIFWNKSSLSLSLGDCMCG